MSKIFYAVTGGIIGLIILSIMVLAFQHSRNVEAEAEQVKTFLSSLPVVKDDSGVERVESESVWRCRASRYGDDCGWERDWVYTETATHLIYDGLYIQRLCPGFYKGFRFVESEDAVAYMAHAKGRKDKWLTLDVKELPARSPLYDTQDCADISVKDGMLMLRGKRLALVIGAHIPSASFTKLLRN
jgi:hypothetical protein